MWRMFFYVRSMLDSQPNRLLLNKNQGRRTRHILHIPPAAEDAIPRFRRVRLVCPLHGPQTAQFVALCFHADLADKKRLVVGLPGTTEELRDRLIRRLCVTIE